MPDYCTECQHELDDICLECDLFFCSLCDRVCPACGFDTRRWFVMRNGSRIWVPVEREPCEPLRGVPAEINLE